jgi:hypothetical protein
LDLVPLYLLDLLFDLVAPLTLFHLVDLYYQSYPVPLVDPVDPYRLDLLFLLVDLVDLAAPVPLLIPLDLVAPVDLLALQQKK